MTTRNPRIRPRALVGLFLGASVVGGVGALLGFELHRRWPIETVEEWLGLREEPSIEPWEVFTTSDLPRYEPHRVQVGKHLYLFGGFHTVDLQTTERSERLDLETGEWSRLAGMPTPVTHAGIARIEDTIWLAGGFVGTHPGAVTAEVWRYSLEADEWSPGPSLPELRGGGALLARHDTLHYFGGYESDRATNSGDHWTLAPGDSIWRTAPPLPRPRGHFTAALVDGRIWAVGGSDGHDPIPVDVTDVHIYDPETRSWTEGPSAPFAFSHAEPSTSPYGTGLIFAGGRSIELGRYSSDDILHLDVRRGRWVHEGRSPADMRGGISARIGDTLFAGLGAESGPVARNPDIWRRLLRDRWRVADSMPVPLGEVAAGVIDGMLYVVGDGSRHTLAYDLASGQWTPPGVLAARPAEGDHHAAEVVDGKLVLIGGLGRRPPHGVVQLYDPTTDTWDVAPPVPFLVGSASTAVIGRTLYLAGGIVADTTTTRAAALDLDTWTWRDLPDMPRGRNHAAAATDGERLYIFGGRGAGSGDGNVVANGFDDVQIYDPATDSWTVSDGSPGAPPPLPQARGGMGKAVYLDGEFWILGGETLDGPGASELGTYGRVDIFDPTSSSWRSGPSLGVPRHGLFPVVHAGRIYVAGGGTQAGFSHSAVMEVIWPSPR